MRETRPSKKHDFYMFDIKGPDSGPEEGSYPNLMVPVKLLGTVFCHWRTHQPGLGLVPEKGCEVA